MKEKIKEWLIKKGVMGDLFPGLFDLPALWRINAKRCRGFNIIFCWIYPVAIFFMVPFTLLGLICAVLSYEDKEKEEKNLKRYYTEVS